MKACISPRDIFHKDLSSMKFEISKLCLPVSVAMYLHVCKHTQVDAVLDHSVKLAKSVCVTEDFISPPHQSFSHVLHIFIHILISSARMSTARLVIIPITFMNHVIDVITAHTLQALSTNHLPVEKPIFNETNDLVA